MLKTRLSRFLLLTAILVFPFFLFGDDGISPLDPSALWAAVLAFVSKLTGGSVTIGIIVLGLVQTAVILFRTTIGQQIAGIWTLAVLYLLNAGAVVLLAVMNGVPVLSALGSSVFLSFAMNGINELIKHALEPKA